MSLLSELEPSVLAAPAVLLLLGGEYLLGRLKGRRLYHLPDALSNLSSNLGQLIVLAMMGATTVGLYQWVHGHLALVDFPADRWWGWVLGWVIADFCWYWRHAFGHRVAVGWAVHEVHHQSPDLNLSVGLRVGYLQWLQTLPFMLPLALLGVPVGMFATLFFLAHTYQLLLHTQLASHLGPLGLVLTTPADHRLHHAANPRYIGKNLGHNLIIWDRLLGTYAVEDPDDPIVFGIDRPLSSWNPVRNNLDPLLELVGLRAAPPESGPTARGGAGARLWAVLWFAVAFGSTFLLVSQHAVWPTEVRWAVGAWLLWTTAAISGLLEAKRSAQRLEPLRVIAGGGLIWLLWSTA